MADGSLIISQPRSAMVPTTIDEAKQIATYLSNSGLFGCKTPEQAFSLMLLADAEGLHPAIAARDYHIIEGRPSLRADAMLARFQNAGGTVRWISRTDEEVSAVFSHDAGGECPITWTIDMARNVKRWNRKKKEEESLADNQNWKNYPRQMLTARVISEGVRTVFPGVVAGMYSPEEVQDFDDSGHTSAPAKTSIDEPRPSKKEEPRLAERMLTEIPGIASISELESWALKQTSTIIHLPAPDRDRVQKAIAAKRVELGPNVQDADFEEVTERDAEADAKFVTEFCRMVLDRPSIETLEALWTKHEKRLDIIKEVDPQLFDEAIKSDATAREALQNLVDA